jgi:gamma-glutamylcyclotransferase (GGCT)/AIG2-like uncharacterized protein YtfP
MASDKSRYLFLYGTLMSGARGVLGSEERLRLARESDSLGPASLVGAHLYDLGDYPGVLLDKPQVTVLWLDEYEGVVHEADDNAYDRLVREVRLAGGEAVDAWIYALHATPSHGRRVVSGRWSSR